MLDIPFIKKLFLALNEHLRKHQVIGEVGICGGAAMCLVFQARQSTKDIDAIFEPTGIIRKACRKIAHDFAIDESWLNDAVKIYFHMDPPKENVLQFSNLRVWAPKADYMLAMKCISARFDTHDKDDIIFLIKYLKLETLDTVLDIISKYYPHHMVSAKTQFLLEEIFQKD